MTPIASISDQQFLLKNWIMPLKVGPLVHNTEKLAQTRSEMDTSDSPRQPHRLTTLPNQYPAGPPSRSSDGVCDDDRRLPRRLRFHWCQNTLYHFRHLRFVFLPVRCWYCRHSQPHDVGQSAFRVLGAPVWFLRCAVYSSHWKYRFIW